VIAAAKVCKQAGSCPWFNRDCLCLDCKEKEMKDKDYKLAQKAEREAIKKGDFNFPGIRK